MNYIIRSRSTSEKDMASEKGVASGKLMEMKGGGQSLTLQELRERVAAYRHEINAYLSGLEANLDTYKFSVEKAAEGFSIDVNVKATVHPKNKAGISK